MKQVIHCNRFSVASQCYNASRRRSKRERDTGAVYKCAGYAR